MSGPAITQLKLSHFRSHRRLDLDLDGRPVVLHGPNGAGKTNILEAVSLLSPGRGLRRASADEMAMRPAGLGWNIDAVLRTADGTHEIQLRSEPGAARKTLIDGKPVPQTALARMIRMIWLVPTMDRIWIEGAEGRRRFLDRLALSFLPGHSDAALGYEKAMRQRNRLLKDDVRDPHWYRALETQMSLFGAQMQDNRRAALARITAAQERTETVFPVARLSLVGPDTLPDPQGAEALAQAWSETRARDLAAGRTLVGPHRIDLEGFYATKDMPARECSTGEQKALLISVVLANARALRDDTGEAPVVLLDEVAAHLDAGRQAALYDEICGLGTQAWMTGTGAEMFAPLVGRAQIIALSEPVA